MKILFLLALACGTNFVVEGSGWFGKKNSCDTNKDLASKRYTDAAKEERQKIANCIRMDLKGHIEANEKYNKGKKASDCKRNFAQIFVSNNCVAKYSSSNTAEAKGLCSICETYQGGGASLQNYTPEPAERAVS